MSDAACEEIRELAAEAALGVATPDSHARVLAHATTCEECGELLADLSRASGAFLTLIRGREPPPGFTARTLRKISEPAPRFRRVLALATAALIGAGVAAAGVVVLTRDDRSVAGHYRSALARASGSYFTAGSLRAPDATAAGQVFAYDGEVSWVYVFARGSAGDGAHAVVVVHADGTTERIGTMRLREGQAVWGTTLTLNVERVVALRLFDPEGRLAYEAALDSS